MARALGLLLLLVLLLASPTLAGPDRYEYRRTCMGCDFTILLYSDDPKVAKLAADAAFARVQALEKILSDYDPESELMRLCDLAGGPPTPISPDLHRVLKDARAWAERTDGAFDPTVGPIVRQWRRARRERKLPSPENLRSALKLVDWRKLSLDDARRTARLEIPGMKLDLGGIAKGDAVQEALRVLYAHRIRSALVAAAGDIAVGDPPPGREGWSVELRPLGPGDPASPHAVLLAERAASTSGDAERYVEIDGIRYSHIVDPRTGLGLTERSGVSVVARDGPTADALATACAVLGFERARPIVEATPGASALFQKRTVRGLETQKTTRLPASIAERKD